jgi:hypothetical protein
VPVRVDRELLSERELDDGLVVATSEDGEGASADRDQECEGGPHHDAIL